MRRTGGGAGGMPMTKILEFSTHTARQQACDWLARLDRGLSPAEELALQAWLAARPENARKLLALSARWDRMDALSRLADLFPETQLTSSTRRPMARQFLATAAALLIGLAIGGWYLIMPLLAERQPAYEQHLTEARFQTGRGEQSTVVLPDGSTLILNTDTVIRSAYSAESRNVYLERGEVHVQVAHNPGHPFFAHIGDRRVRAVGTAFNLQFTAGHPMELIVTEGRVLVEQSDEQASAVEGGGGPVAPLTAGQRMVISDAVQKVSVVPPEDIQVRLSWRRGNLIFRGESLEQAIGEISRYTSVKFEFQDEALKHVRIAGLFRTGDVEGLLATLKENFNVSYRRPSPEQVILTRE